MRNQLWRFGSRCPICGERSWRACGARAGEKIVIGGGYYKWAKWNPCSEYAPGGHAPTIHQLAPDGELDDLSDIVVSTEGGTEINTVR